MRLQIDPGRLGDLVCGNFATGDAKDLHDLAWDNMYGLDSHGSTANPRHDIFVVEGKKCKRVNCWNTSALYVSLPCPLLPTVSTFRRPLVIPSPKIVFVLLVVSFPPLVPTFLPCPGPFPALSTPKHLVNSN